jgi:hypothetical protein
MTDEKKPPQGAGDMAAELLALVHQIAADVAAMRESQAATAKEFNRQCVMPLIDPL